MIESALSSAGLPVLGLSVTGWAASIGVGLIFLSAGLEKLRHRAILPGVIANYRLLPEAGVPLVATLLPPIEIALGVTLVIGIAPVPTLLAIGLLGLFAAAMAINIARGRRKISCGCGRPDLEHNLNWALVARNIGLASLLSARLQPGEALAPLDLVSAMAGGASLWLVYTLFNAIGALRVSTLAATRR